MTSTVRIPWNRDRDNEYRWNEVCVWVTELFGLPGDRYLRHANVNYIEYVFTSNKDALLMSLRWNAQIITEQELTVEFVGSRL
jgi:hypothetical protein